MAGNKSSQGDSRAVSEIPLSSVTDSKATSKRASADVRLQFWIPGAVYDDLVKEAAANGMTVATWTAYVLAKRPEKVVEKVLLPKGTKEQIAQLEKELAASKKDVAFIKPDYVKVVREVQALKGKLEDLLKQSANVKCPGCGEKIAIDFGDEKVALKASGTPKH